MLYDLDGRLADECAVGVAVAGAADVRAWEALARLDGAREMALRLWAVAEDVPYPLFGLTSLLDVDPPRLPDGLEATAPDIDLDRIAAAAVACAALLRRAAAAARERIGTDGGESPMAAWVSDRLR